MRVIIFRLRLPSGIELFFICVTVALVISFAGSSTLYKGARLALRNEVRGKLMAIARTAALRIDPEVHRQIRTRADEQGTAYREIQSALREIRKANPGIRYIYTMRKTGQKDTWAFVVDAEEDIKKISHVGDKYDITQFPEMRKAFDGPCADKEPTQDRWGIWLSGYAPIRNRSGQAEAIVGLDMSMEQLRIEESELRRAMVRNEIAAVIIAILISTGVTWALMKPIHTLTRAAERIRNGDFDFEVKLRGFEEIRQLGQNFNHMIRTLRENQRLLTERANLDFVTNQFNHRYLHERLSTEIERAKRFDRKLCLLLCDIDRFKAINDLFGHFIGDSILRQLSEVLRRNVRSIDIVARYGGDEFAIILTETGRESGTAMAERIRQAVEEHTFCRVPLEQLIANGDSAPGGGKEMKLTITIGLACYPEDGVSCDSLLMAADIALCQAKHVARNSVGVYDPPAGDELDTVEVYQALRRPNPTVLGCLSATVDARNCYTFGHSERVARYALLVAESLGLDRSAIETLRIAALLHDLGKIEIADSIINKPESLTKLECEIIREHPSKGGEILKRAAQLEDVIPAVMLHHERWDGLGYPDGLSGEQIPLFARILAVADAFDAMTSERPYRKAMSIETALLELQAYAGKQFDPNIVKALIKMLSESESQAA